MTASPDPLVGRTLAGRYLVEKRIGMGGMGAVYIGTQHPLGRKVAIKVLLGGLAADTSARERFQREATAVASLNHPGIVTVYDFGQTDDGTWFIAMEFVSGQTLKSVLDTHKRLAWPRAVDIAKQTATALSVAHDQGIVHRDLKPENIMLVPQGDGTFLVKILDFGLAKLAEGREGGPLGQPLTQRSVIMGTPGYMSPEQIQGQAIDHRCDLYALGAILWEMVVGHQPLRDDNPIKILMRHLAETIPAPSSARPEAAIPGRGDALILRLLEKDRERRPQRTADVAAALLALASEPWVAPAAVALDAAPDPGDWDVAFKALDEVPAPKKAVVGTPDSHTTTVVPVDALPLPPATAATAPTALLPPPSLPRTTATPSPAPAPTTTAPTTTTPAPSAPPAPAPSWSPPPVLPPPSAFGPPPLMAGPGLQLAGPRAAALELAGPTRPTTRMTSTGAAMPTRPAPGPGIPEGMKKALLAVGLLTSAAAVHFVFRGGLEERPLGHHSVVMTPGPSGAAVAVDKAEPARPPDAARTALLDGLRTRKDRALAALVDDKATIALARDDVEVAVARARALLALQRRDDVVSTLRPFAGDGTPPATRSRVGALITRARLGPLQGDDAFVKARPLSLVAALAAAPADVAAALPLWVAAPVPLPARLDDDERLVLDGPAPKDPVARAMRELARGSGASLTAVLKSRPKDPAVLLLAAAQDLDSGRLDDARKKLLAVGRGGPDPRLQEATLVVGARLAAARGEPDALARASALREGPVRDLVVLSVQRIVGGDAGAAVAAVVARDVLSARAREFVE